MPKLNQTFADSVPREGLERPAFYWDSELKGFGLKVTQQGGRRWVFKYEDRKRSRRNKRLTLGDASKLPAAKARRLALQMAAAVIDGEDPSEERRKSREGLTVAELAERYLEEHARAKKKPSSANLDEGLLRRCILPHLGALKVAEISGPDVRRMHHALRKTPVQANRALLVLSKALNLAEAWGLRPAASNPCRGLEKFRERRRQRFLSGEELQRLGVALREAEEENEPPSAILALRLLLLSGARHNEILTLRWNEVNLERGCLELQDSKSGPKTIPLGAPALRLLADAVRVEGNPFVCPGHRHGRPFVGIQKVWERIRVRAGLEDARIHDLRHSFASVGAGGGLGLPIIGALLGHTQMQTTQRYSHLAADPLHQAAERISSEISAALEGQTGELLKFEK